MSGSYYSFLVVTSQNGPNAPTSKPALCPLVDPVSPFWAVLGPGPRGHGRVGDRMIENGAVLGVGAPCRRPFRANALGMFGPKWAKGAKNRVFNRPGCIVSRIAWGRTVWTYSCCGVGHPLRLGICHFGAQTWPLLAWNREVAAGAPPRQLSGSMPHQRQQSPSIPTCSMAQLQSKKNKRRPIRAARSEYDKTGSRWYPAWWGWYLAGLVGVVPGMRPHPPACPQWPRGPRQPRPYCNLVRDAPAGPRGTGQQLVAPHPHVPGSRRAGQPVCTARAWGGSQPAGNTLRGEGDS